MAESDPVRLMVDKGAGEPINCRSPYDRVCYRQGAPTTRGTAHRTTVRSMVILPVIQAEYFPSGYNTNDVDRYRSCFARSTRKSSPIINICVARNTIVL